MSRSELFTQLIQKHGYRSIYQFCKDNKLPQSNMSNRLNSTTNLELSLLFQWANILHEPVETLIMIFYPEQWEENRKNID